MCGVFLSFAFLLCSITVLNLFCYSQSTHRSNNAAENIFPHLLSFPVKLHNMHVRTGRNNAGPNERERGSAKAIRNLEMLAIWAALAH